MRPHLLSLLLIFCCGTSGITQEIEHERQMFYYSHFQSIDSLIKREEYKKAYDESLVLYQSYPEEPLPFAASFFATLTRYSYSDEDEMYVSDELDDSLYNQLEIYLDIALTKFAEVEFVQFMVAGYYEEMGDYEKSIEHIEEKLSASDFPGYYAALLNLYSLNEDEQNLNRIAGLVRKKSTDDVVYKRMLIKHYYNKRELDSARIFNDQIIGGLEAKAADFYQSALINFRMNNKFQACEDLRSARRKGYNQHVPWEERLNCFNEDRSNPIAVAFDAKLKSSGILANSPERISRKDWVPPNNKRYYYKNKSEKETFSLYTVGYYSQRNEGGFIYYTSDDHRSFFELKLRMFSIYPNLPWENRKGDTLFSSSFGNILPIEFEKDKSIFVEKALGERMEFTYLGNEEVTLASGVKLICAKMRMARLLDGYLQDLDYYWFCNQRGWVASESMDGTRVEVLK